MGLTILAGEDVAQRLFKTMLRFRERDLVESRVHCRIKGDNKLVDVFAHFRVCGSKLIETEFRGTAHAQSSPNFRPSLCQMTDASRKKGSATVMGAGPLETFWVDDGEATGNMAAPIGLLPFEANQHSVGTKRELEALAACVQTQRDALVVAQPGVPA